MRRHRLLLPCLLLIGLAACGECAEDYDCPGEKICRSGTCAQAACTSDRACPPGRRCRTGKCDPTPPLAAPPAADAVLLHLADAGAP